MLWVVDGAPDPPCRPRLGSRSQTLSGHHAASANYDLSPAPFAASSRFPAWSRPCSSGATVACASGDRPGTGKTALAHHIARALGQPLQMRKASDLLGPYVGETEQRPPQCFMMRNQMARFCC